MVFCVLQVMRSKVHLRSHPLHPVLVMFPVAFFTGALVFDLLALGMDRAMLHMVAFYLCWAGIAGALLAAVPGFIDFLYAVPPNSSAKKRGALHGILNVVVLCTFSCVVFLRREEFSVPVLLMEVVAVGLLYTAGWMGATLVHRNQISVDHRYARAGKFREARFPAPRFPLAVAEEKDLLEDQMMLLHVGSRRIVLARDPEGYVAFDDRCTHRGASLADGVMMCGRVHCPWHGSQYSVRSGERLAGPADTGIQIYKVEERDGKIYLHGLG
jgi:uncharacterized membrane protein/nitrite reductase/ring-hydroxylating ferredoxin subunit